MRKNLLALFLLAPLALGCDDSQEGETTAGPDAGVQETPDAGPRCPAGASSAPGTVVVETGAVQGIEAGEGWAFKGIPFAKPPVRARRWTPPGPADCFQGVREAFEFGPACAQLDGRGNATGSEDCLTLNVWTPDPEPGEPRPVLVFLHGGGNLQGSGSEPLYDSQKLAARGAVVVTANYRLGIFGFLAHPKLSAQGEHQVSGNYGLLDQIEALRWVKANIAAFGGDPARVTVFGESAGGFDICSLVASPLAAGLFERAIIQSGGCVGPTLTAMEAFGEKVVARTDCATSGDVPACLRGLSTEDLLAAEPGSIQLAGTQGDTFWSNVDGYVLPQHPLQAIKAGKHNKVSLVIGANADETSQAVASNPPADEAEYKARVYAALGKNLGDSALALYPVSDYSPEAKAPAKAFTQLTTDARFVCPSRAIAKAMASSQPDPVYRYFFTKAPDRFPALGAFHGLELVFVFGNFSVIPTYVPSARETALSNAMMGYWTSFAETGSPAGEVIWPRYDPSKDPVVILGDAISAQEGVRTAKCDFWDSVPSQY